MKIIFMIMMMLSYYYLCSALVVKREDIVSSPCLALSHQEVPMTTDPGMLYKVGSPHTWYGSMEPWVRGQEVIRFIVGVLCEHSKSQRGCGGTRDSVFTDIWIWLSSDFLPKASGRLSCKIVSSQMLVYKNEWKMCCSGNLYSECNCDTVSTV